MQPVSFKTFVLISILISTLLTSNAQKPEPYQWPTDPLVKKKLTQWQDLKFGIIIHWGLYAVPGIIESWSICSEDWIDRDSTIGYDEYKKWYFGLEKDFNPVNFNPDAWAAAAKDAGMRYLVFTTKHHDGFAMFDTKHSDFKISDGPFKGNERADVAKHVFNAFRKNHFMIGAYFSKPDWHNENYWWPKYATADRNNNYDIRKYPWRWNKFKEFTHGQLSELMNNYGGLDILWLDGGWVRPRETVNDEVRSWGARIPEWSQDIDMTRIAIMARRAQPGILIVDRTVHGPYENYRTPEQRIPQTKLDYPWESCMTVANNWGYVPGDKYKSSAQVIHSLVEIVAKGGNLLLGVGPKPDGTLPDEALQRMREIGEWMKGNGEAIYNTRPSAIYQQGRVYFTQNRSKRLQYAIVLFKDDETVPAAISWKGNIPKRNATVKLVETEETLKWRREGDVVKVSLPGSLVGRKGIPAVAISFAGR